MGLGRHGSPSPPVLASPLSLGQRLIVPKADSVVLLVLILDLGSTLVVVRLVLIRRVRGNPLWVHQPLIPHLLMASLSLMKIPALILPLAMVLVLIPPPISGRIPPEVPHDLPSILYELPVALVLPEFFHLPGV